MITNAKDKLIGTIGHGLPDMSSSVRSFFQPISVGVTVKEMVDGVLKERVTFIDTKGVIQPMTAEKLSIKSEGERSWKWFTIHCETDLILVTDDMIQILGTIYRVMDKSDYSAYGYVEYEVQQDYAKVAD